MTLTPKCSCSHPDMVHSHVGCMVKGCDCQHGIPATREQLIDAQFVDAEIIPLPKRFADSFNEENPGGSIR